MTIKLRQSTASQEVPLGIFVDATDGVTAETGLTIANTDIKLWKMGATTLANKNSGGATHISGGIYFAVLDATDTNTLGGLVIFVQVAGALPVRLECEVLTANLYDSLIAGTDVLDVSTTQFNGTAVTQTGGRPEVNVTHAAGTAWNSGGIGAATLAADTLTAAKVASDVGTEIAAAVWGATTRRLSDGTNIALAKGTGITGFNDLDAAGVRSAVGLASANLDTQLSTIDGVADSILADTAEIGAAGAGLTALASASALATVDGNVDSILTDTGTTLPAQIAALNNLSAADVNAEVDSAIADAALATAAGLATVDGNVDSIKVTTDKLDDTLEDDAGTFRFTSNSLEQAPTGGSAPTVSEIADEVQTRTIAAVTVVNGLAANAITAAAAAADFGTEVGSAVWASTTRELTSGNNIALAKGTGLTGLNDLSAADVNSEVDTAIADAGLATAANLATVDANVDAILEDTGTTLPATLAGLATAAALATVDGNVDAILEDTAEIGAAGAGLTALASAAALATVDANVDSILEDTGTTLPASISTIDTVADAIKVTTDKLDDTLEDDAGTFRFTTNALEQGPSGSGASAATIAAAVWDEVLAGHDDAGSAGEALSAAGTAGDPWLTELPGAYGAGTAGKIIGDNIDALISTRATPAEVASELATYDGPTNAEMVARTLAAADYATATAAAAIQAKTDNLPSDPADASVVAGLISGVEAKVDTIDTVADAIKAKTDNLPTDPADHSLIVAATNSLAALIGTPAVTLADDVAGVLSQAEANEAYAARTVIRGTVSGTSPTTTEFTASALAPAGVDADQFKGRIIIFDNDTATAALRGQATDITANTAASLPRFTFTALTTAPASGDTFSVV